MSDPFDPPEPEEPSSAAEPPHEGESGPFPWDEPVPEDPDATRQRHDAFTEAKKCAFLKALVKTGGILDACRLAGVGARTVYRHQESDPRFFENCKAALRMSGTPVELTAWQRAVEGVEQEFACGGQVYVRRRYDSGLLRLLLQGSNPKKYGPRPGFKRKQILKHERKQMEREIRAELEAQNMPWTFDDAMSLLERKLRALGIPIREGDAEEDAARLDLGWTKSPDGHWVPPGYAPIPGWVPPPAPQDGEEPPRDSM